MVSSAGGHFGIFWANFGVQFFFSSETFNIFSWKFSQVFKNFMAPFYILSSTVSKLQGNYEQTVYLLPLTPQKFLVLVLLWWS